MRIQNCPINPEAGVTEVGTAALTLAFDVSQGSGISALQEWYTSLSSLALLRDANPGGSGMRAPGWVLTFKLVRAYRPEARLESHSAPGRPVCTPLVSLICTPH